MTGSSPADSSGVPSESQMSTASPAKGLSPETTPRPIQSPTAKVAPRLRDSSRPQSVEMPSPPEYHQVNSNSPRLVGKKPITPTGSDQGYSTAMLSGSGPLSPSSNLGSQSFVFPIRSVFQDMVPSDSQSSNPSDNGQGASLNRTSSRGSAIHGRSPSRQETRRYSLASNPAGDLDNDIGIQSITQLLQANRLAEAQKPPSGQPAVATFSGRTDRAASGSRLRLDDKAGGPPPGFFSMPILENESRHSPFFISDPLRRSSDGIDTQAVQSTPDLPRRSSHGINLQTMQSPPDQTSALRPKLDTENSDDTVHEAQKTSPDAQDTPRTYQNASAATEGNGLPQKDRAPVGQPQVRPTEPNFSDKPGPSPGRTTFSTVKQDHRVNPPQIEDQPPTQHPHIRQPKPRSAALTGLEGIAASHNQDYRRGSTTQLVLDENGERTLVQDFSDIIHLADLGSGSHSEGSRSQRGEGSAGRPSQAPSQQASSSANAKAAQQQHQITRQHNATQESVRNFVNDQAHTVTMDDPNAPTPAPLPTKDVEVPAAGLGLLGQGRGLGIRAQEEGLQTAASSDSLSTKESSEVATVSEGDDLDVAEDGQSTSDAKPIVTFRFEHVATEDGHHVVVGREGELTQCEDEPITTPGAVQGFGVLLVMEENFDTGVLTVRQVSENSTELLGLSPKYLFRLDCFTRILPEEQEDTLRDNLEYLPESESGRGSVQEEGPQVFLLSGFGEPGSDNSDAAETRTHSEGPRREWTCWVAAHRPNQSSWEKVDANGKAVEPPNLIILEFELERDEFNPLIHPFESTELSGGPETPDSGSQTTASAGSFSGNERSGSANSENDSQGTVTTIASTPTPRPAMPESHDSGATDTTVRPKSATDSNSTTQPDSSSTWTGQFRQPMGLEGLEVDTPLHRIIESTTNHAKPLRALERMRRTGLGRSNSQSGTSSGRSRGTSARRGGRRPTSNSTGTMDVFAVLGQINDQLGAAPDLDTFLKVVVGVVQDLCRFHRVLLYQFDESFNGQVVAELVEWGKTTDLFRGLMFPAADIPAQARQLYAINKVRLLYDRSQTTARMVLRSKEDLEHPLDMTHCYLRAMSPIHLKCRFSDVSAFAKPLTRTSDLGNMGVRSSMSVSIMAFGQLWGLIACHGYGYHGMRVSFPVRQMLRILSDSISRNIERLSYAQRLHTRKLISTIPTQQHPTGYIVSNADDLLQIFDADAGMLIIGDGCKLLGKNSEQGIAMVAIAEFLRIKKFDTLKATSFVSRDFPDLILPRAADSIAGLLFVPLTVNTGQDFIVLLRRGQSREVHWAGKPYKDEESGNAASLEPRKSFKTWSETVTGRSRAWTDDQLESAGVLALIYGKFIQVWREKQSAMASNQLTAILLSNTSHAVRTPLSQIINTLELALSGEIDQDTRAMLENSHKASRALLFHVHDLLDLTKIETGNETGFNDPFDLRQTVKDAVRLYVTEAERRGLEFKIDMSPDLPPQVVGDARKIKTIISNLVANSVKYTTKGQIVVICKVRENQASGENTSKTVPIEITIEDTGCGIAQDKLSAMFVTLEGAEETRSEGTGVGLGLAVVARIVVQLGGQLRAESQVGTGSRFWFTLNMPTEVTRASSRTSSKGSEIQLGSRTGSSSHSSAVSLRSGSEIESFVNDFAASHMLNEPTVSPDDERLLAAEKRMSRPGTFAVTDSSWPIRPTRVGTEDEQWLPDPVLTPSVELDSVHRLLLVAQDKRILTKRLKMDKHTVVHANNGQEAVDELQRSWDIDVILMDIQMPIMDGRQAAHEIREREKTLVANPDIDPLRIAGQIPIFAVSASLYESDRGNLAKHFDGWLLKPLDFSRVRALLAALDDPEKRSAERYVQGHWERGGYLRVDAVGTPPHSLTPPRSN
ncbi:hypothetical protein BCR39DRAFT_504567 [Naematelia encephala]|uniref:Uncharacterized protein n=1 Tax=Naematelia encephala TaxID=71784 RepID=A0A1Y2BAX4_9TREE|nr:hypothetical protein BCR39DRAFT_504567 [Naematelia encephala]